MKFLVIGFSEQAQKTLEVLLQLEFPVYSYCSVPRQLSEKYTCLVPNTSAYQQKCDLCIVDLDGVGLSQYNIQTRETLTKIINHKPSVLISRQSYTSWGRDLLLSKKCVVLNHIYTRQELLDALFKIIKIGEADSQVNTKTSQSLRSIYANPSENIHSIEQEIKNPPIAERAKLSKRVLSQRWVDYHKYPIVERLLDIFSQSSPYWLNIYDHKLLIDPRQGVVVLKSLSVVDYFTLISGFNFSVFKLEVRSLLSEDYTKQKENLLNNGYRVYSLNLLIWQIIQEILPYRLNLNTNNLRIKLKYMPNLTALRNVPSYMHALSAACLVSAISFDDLKARFSHVQDEHINRFFFLVLLTDILDSSLIVSLDVKSVQIQTNTRGDESSSMLEGVSNKSMKNIAESQADTKSNDSVEKAKKTGFFARLLQKLSL